MGTLYLPEDGDIISTRNKDSVQGYPHIIISNLQNHIIACTYFTFGSPR
jgi:hypothetical protein